MRDENFKKGILFGIISVVLVGIEPIIVISKPDRLDSFLFATMTFFTEIFIFLPFLIYEIWKNNKEGLNQEVDPNKSFLSILMTHKYFFIFIGIIFGIAQILYNIGYSEAGGINGSIAQKTTVIFALLFGFLINNEKFNKYQIVFCLLLFFGLILAITAGSFNLLRINLGVLILTITAMLWMFAHSLSKVYLAKNEFSPIQIFFIRTIISTTFLLIVYFIFFPIENYKLILDPSNQIFYISMGIAHGGSLLCWYKTLDFLGTSRSSVIDSSSPIITIIFTFLFFNKILTYFQLIGAVIVLTSIVMIFKLKKGDENQNFKKF